MKQDMVVVVVSIQVKSERREEFILASLDNARHTRKEPGNIRFDVVQSEDDPDQFLLYEVYESGADRLSHQQTAHYLTWRETVKDWMKAPRTSVKYRALFFGDHKLLNSTPGKPGEA